jgi:hypothetical protein
MPTRLLDWSTNPLAALFFACKKGFHGDGFVYAMDAKTTIPEGAMKDGSDPLHRAIMTTRHPFVKYAIGLAFWEKVDPRKNSYVLPVRPEVIPGRISQQSSCFTLHMHKAKPVENASMLTMSIAGEKKDDILDELRQLNINEFTIYADLDHLSKEIGTCWGISSA